LGAYELEYARRILRVIADFTAEEWREIRRLCQLIRLDPLQDNRNKIVLLQYLPVVFYAYVTQDFWIVYHVTRNRVIINNIGRAGYSEPAPW
jgi:hypothetical protein